MSSTSALENHEDLEHVTLVRMEDVQPERNPEMYLNTENELIRSCVIDNLEYDHECVIDDDDSNIGSMVSIKSEEAEDSDHDTSEYIVPDLLESPSPVKMAPLEAAQKGWPTLEILPGGVIKDADKYKSKNDLCYEKETTLSNEMVYACAKCPRKYKYLFCLVKHVKLHEERKKKVKPAKSILKSILKGNNETKRVGGLTNKKKIMTQLRSKCNTPKNL